MSNAAEEWISVEDRLPDRHRLVAVKYIIGNDIGKSAAIFDEYWVRLTPASEYQDFDDELEREGLRVVAWKNI